MLTDEQTGLLLKAAPQYPDCRMLAMPKVAVRENELLPLWIGDKIPYTAGYEEPNEPAGKPKPRQATVDSGLTFETTAHLVGQDRVRLDCVLRMTTLLGFDEKKYQGRYRYQVPRTEDAVFSLDHPIVPSGGTSLTLGPKARLKTSPRPQTILILATPSIVGGKTSPAADTVAHPADSRAWSILRQWNCPPLLLGLTPQLTKMLEPSRRNDPVWQEVANGGTLRLRLDVEGGLPGEVIVGLFKDAAWLTEPVAVRRLGGAGTHTLKGLPAGRYQIGAMIGGAPVPVALGVQRTWPEPIEIQRDQTVTADVLVSEAFQKWASGWYNEGVAKDYVGQWGDLNETNLLQGQLTGPDGKPIPFGLIEIREHNPGARSTATADQGTNEQGLYKYDGMNWPYQVTALWRQAIPSAFGYRRQRMYLSRVLEGPQRMDFRFEPFPEGTAKVAGRLIDQNGKPVKGFFLRVHMPPFNDLDLSRLTGGYKTQVTYDVPFISEDGRFELGGLPAGRATVDIIPFEVQRYQHERGKDVVLAAGETAQVDVALVGKGVFHGRVLFEDGTPAVITPAPWRGAVTRILMTFGPRAGSIGEVGPDGYFTLYLEDSDTEALAQGNSRLVIDVPSDQERRWDKAGEFPYEKLAEDKAQAGTVTVKRPAFMTTPAATTPPAGAAVPVELRSVGSPEEMRKARELQENPDSDPLVRRMKKYAATYKDADTVPRMLMDRISQVQRGLGLLQQTLAPTHPAVIEKKALLATLQKELAEKPTGYEWEFWDKVRPRHFIFDGTLASIRADEKLDAETATQAFALIAQADDAARASMSLDELRTSTVPAILQRLGAHLPDKPFQALLQLLESKGLVSRISESVACQQEDLSGKMGVSTSGGRETLNVLGDVLEPEQAVLLDIQATVTLTEPVPRPAGQTGDPARPPDSVRTLAWAGKPVIAANRRHTVLQLDASAPDAGRPHEVYCLLVKPTIVEAPPSPHRWSPGL